MPDYYLRTHPQTGVPFSEVWEVDSAQAHVIGNSSFQSYAAEPGATPLEVIRRSQSHWFDGQGGFHRLARKPGEYHPLIDRPERGLPVPPQPRLGRGDYNLIAVSRGQLLALAGLLGRICQTAHPVRENFGTFGHDIRNLLILACTEVESHWRSVLRANAYAPALAQDARLSTADYVRLKEAMRLGEYAIAYPAFPWLGPFKPFEQWAPSAPTQTLVWYDAYNAVKHDGGRQFERGTLERAFEAVSACLVMLCAQFGWVETVVTAPVREFFWLESAPDWPLADVYLPPIGTREWQPVPYPF